MDARRIAGIALLVIGVALIWIGYASTDSVADKVHETLTGRYTQKTLGYLLGGAVAGVSGALLALIPARKEA